jgi:hypothetical protein
MYAPPTPFSSPPLLIQVMRRPLRLRLRQHRHRPRRLHRPLVASPPEPPPQPLPPEQPLPQQPPPSPQQPVHPPRQPHPHPPPPPHQRQPPQALLVVVGGETRTRQALLFLPRLEPLQGAQLWACSLASELQRGSSGSGSRSPHGASAPLLSARGAAAGEGIALPPSTRSSETSPAAVLLRLLTGALVGEGAGWSEGGGGVVECPCLECSDTRGEAGGVRARLPCEVPGPGSTEDPLKDSLPPLCLLCCSHFSFARSTRPNHPFAPLSSPRAL